MAAVAVRYTIPPTRYALSVSPIRYSLCFVGLFLCQVLFPGSSLEQGNTTCEGVEIPLRNFVRHNASQHTPHGDQRRSVSAY